MISSGLMIGIIAILAFVAVIMFTIYPVVFYTLIGVAVFLGVVYLCSKYRWARIATAIIVYLAMFFGMVFSYFKLDQYYSAVGGLFGRIDNFFETNQVTVDENLKFTFSNINLTATGNENEYSAKIVLNQTYSVEDDTVYQVFVDGLPCGFVQSAQDYILADFSQTFYNKEMEEDLTDTLKFRFAFNKNYTEFNITTNGGFSAVKYWNSFFEKNGFVVDVKPSKYAAEDSTITDGQVTYAVARFFIFDQDFSKPYLVQVYHVGDTVVFPEVPSYPIVPDTSTYVWSIDLEDIKEPFVITKDTNFELIKRREAIVY